MVVTNGKAEAEKQRQEDYISLVRSCPKGIKTYTTQYHTNSHSPPFLHITVSGNCYFIYLHGL